MKLVAPKAGGTPTALRTEAKSFSCAKRVIGRRDVAAVPGGSLLKVPGNALVTQLAHDAARQRGVRIEKEV